MCAQPTEISFMAVATKSRKTDRLVARVTPEDKALLERAADLEGRSVEAFVVSHVRSAAKKVVKAHDVISLNAAESRRFVEALLAPPRPPSEYVKAAVAHYRATVIER
jgi:uncharacterized protein (DUF1778 family)